MNFRTTLIIFAVFILLGGAYLLFWQGEPDEDANGDGQQKIGAAYGLDKDKIRQIRLSFKDESYQSMTLAKNSGGLWQLTHPITADADGAKIDNMLRELLNKKIKRRLEVTELSQYGLNPYNIQIEIWEEATTPTKTFLIGDKTIHYSVYTKEKSEGGVILIESSILDDFTKSPSDLRDRTVLKFESENVSEMTLQVTDQAEIRCQKSDENEWKMVHPVEAKADVKEIGSILTALDTLKVAVFEADGAVDLAKYELDSPRIRVKLQLSENNGQELLIGGEAGTTGRIYVKRAEEDSIYAVSKEIHIALNKTVFDLRDKRVIDFQRTATNRFEIEQAGQKIVCEKNADDEWEIKEPVTLKADASAVDDLLFGVDALKAVEFVSDHPKSLQPYGLDRPSIQISFMATDAEPTTFLIGKQKDDTVYVKAQNAENVVLVKTDILELVGMGVAGLRDKQVIDFSSDDATKLTLQHGEVNLTCQKQGTNWRLTKPVQEDAKNGAVNSIIYQINTLEAEKFLVKMPNVVAIGLDNPQIQVTVTLDSGKEYVLQIGKLDESKRLYARLWREPNTIFLLKADIADELKKTVEDLRATSDGA